VPEHFICGIEFSGFRFVPQAVYVKRFICDHYVTCKFLTRTCACYEKITLLFRNNDFLNSQVHHKLLFGDSQSKKKEILEIRARLSECEKNSKLENFYPTKSTY
jgi:hypothetical protein